MRGGCEAASRTRTDGLMRPMASPDTRMELPDQDSNLGPSPQQGAALPTELSSIVELVGLRGIEPRPAGLQPAAPPATLQPHVALVDQGGFEPPTSSLSARRPHRTGLLVACAGQDSNLQAREGTWSTARRASQLPNRRMCRSVGVPDISAVGRCDDRSPLPAVRVRLLPDAVHYRVRPHSPNCRGLSRERCPTAR